MAEELAQIAKQIGAFSSTASSFKQAASQNNDKISKAIKDINSIFASQRKDIAGISKSIESALADSQEDVTRKIDATNSILQNFGQTQNLMVTRLSDMVQILTKIEKNTSNTNKPSALDSVTDAAGNAAKSLLPNSLKTLLGIGGGAVAAKVGSDAIGAYNKQADVAGMGNVPGGAGEDQKVDNILKTIKGKESGGDYSTTSFAEGKGSTASGGYQFTDDTWKKSAAKLNIDTKQYPRAKDAPPEVQDAVARQAVKDILRQVNGDVSKVPNVWYTGNPEGRMTPNQLAVNKGLTSEQYQKQWMQKYTQVEAESAKQAQAAPQQTQSAPPPPAAQGGAGSSTTGGGGPAPDATKAGGSTATGDQQGPPPNLQVGPNADLSKVDPDLLKKFYTAVSAYGKPVTVESGFRDDQKQAELWVRGNILHEQGIYTPAKPKNATKVTINGQTYDVPGGGSGSPHTSGKAIDSPQAADMQQAGVLKQAGLVIPNPAGDPVHIQTTTGGTPDSGGGGPQAIGGPSTNITGAAVGQRGAGYGVDSANIPNFGMSGMGGGPASMSQMGAIGRGRGGGGMPMGAMLGMTGMQMDPLMMAGGMMGGMKGAAIGGLVGTGLDLVSSLFGGKEKGVPAQRYDRTSDRAPILNRRAAEEAAAKERATETAGQQPAAYSGEEGGGSQSRSQSSTGMDHDTSRFFGNETSPSWYNALKTAYPHDMQNVRH